MKNKFRLISTFIVILTAFTSIYSQTVPVDSLYLGQTPPGTTPKIFQLPVRSGLFAAERIAISADNAQIYYSELDNYPFTISIINSFKYANNKWNGPVAVAQNFMAPALSIDGNRLFCEDNNNNPQSFYSTKTDTGWSTPSKFLIKLKMSHYFQETNPGNYYVTSNPLISSNGDIDQLTVSAADTSVKYPGVPINSVNNDQDFYIAKDESYIIRGVLNNGAGSLYISYHKADGTWTNPKTLGSGVNCKQYEWGPYVTADKKYLFYSAEGPAQPYNKTTFIYWVRIDSLIDSLKHTDFAPYAKGTIASQKATKGALFTYTVPDSLFYDDDNDSLTYSASLNTGSPLPSWLSFNPATRTFSGTPVSTTSVFNPLQIEVTASDPSHESGSCVFSLSVVSPTSVNDNKSQLPRKSQLLQNYPNPFNPSTIINYYVANPTFVRLEVYNMLGQKIRSLQKVFQSAGEYSLVWNGMDDSNNSVSSGVYFYRLQADNFIIQKKMIYEK